ncbi:LppX_LprAFG lipoprotein [Arthrobacter alpinus]|nr:LppX_LprAFG lipoprotein [Arthrobacter alpinus]
MAAAEAGAPKDAASLAITVQEATKKLTTLTFTSEMSVAGQVISGSGQQKMSGGKVETAKISQKMGDMGQIDMIIVDGKVFIKLPAAMLLGTAEQPWVEVDEASSNPAIAAMWTSLKPTLESSPVDTYSDFIQATSSVTLVGPETVDGVKTNHYKVDVDPSKLPADSQEKAQLEAAGLTSIPTEMWIDESGRPVKLTQKMDVQGQGLSTTMTFSDYGSPVYITAPPAGEISPS